MEQRLHVAARAGDIDALYSLLTEDAHLLDRIEKVPFMDTPLHIAAYEGQVHFAMEIMRLKPSFARMLNQNGYSPIHLALQNEKTKLVLRLLDADGDLVRVQGREGQTPLHFAAECGMVDHLDEFLSDCPESIQDLTIRKESALHVAVKNGQLEALKVLLGWLERVGKDGPVLKWCDDEGNTLLHVAASTNQIEVVNLLIARARGVDVNAINMNGMTALDISQQPNRWVNPEIRDSLIHAGALEAASLPSTKCSLHYPSIDTNRRDERLSDAAMKRAAEAGDVGVLYSLIREDPYILERFDDAPYVETPLHVAARLGHFNFAMEIMRWKPSFAAKPNQEGLCPIHIATINGHIQTLKRLLNFDKGLVRLKGREGKTSLHYAAEKGHTLVLVTLSSFCPQSIIDVTDQRDTALHVALKYSKFEAFLFLLAILRTAINEGSSEQEKKVLESQDDEGNTVLHIAVQMNQPQVVRQLLSNDELFLQVFKQPFESEVKLVDAKNAEGLTALDVSRAHQAQGNTEIMKMLLKAKASSGLSDVRSVAPSIDNWLSNISWTERVVTSMIRFKRDITTESRNMLLVVTVLIATIMYEAAVDPPASRDDNKDISSMLKNQTNSSSANSTTHTNCDPFLHSGLPLGIKIFWTTNILGLLSSLLTILALLPSKYISSLLHFPIYSFLLCYMATTGITGSLFYCLLTVSFLFILLVMLAYVSTICCRVKQRRLIT